MKIFIFLALFLLPLSTRAQDETPSNAAPTQSYTTVGPGGITVTPLSNGVQVRIVADGILQVRSRDLSGQKMEISFPSARNGTGKNFINVNRYPVSYLQITTPPGVVNGIGMTLQIANFVDTRATVTATPDGQGVLLTILSDRTIERSSRSGGAGTAATEDSGKPDTSTAVTYENKLISVRAVRADIHSLMAAIAQKTGLSIAIDDAVERKVSLNLQGVDPLLAVQSIATAYGLALLKSDGILMVSEGTPTDLATYHLSGTQSYRMQNTQAQTASGLLPNFLYSYVKVNAEQNAVVVSAPSQMLAKIGADLNKVDVPSPQILIQAIAVEFTDTTDFNLGLSLGLSRLGDKSLPETTSNPRSVLSSISGPGGTVTYSSIGTLPGDFQARLDALQRAGKARVRARPQMAAVNGRTADIFIGAQRFIQVQFNGYGGGQTQTKIQPVDVGVKLSITPLTGGNGEITTRIAPEISNITELDQQSGLPVLSTRRADTTVRVKDGETIAIGGLTLDQEQITRGKIPFLGDIPFLGGLFRSRQKNVVRTELVIFVTPRILPTAQTSSGAP